MKIVVIGNGGREHAIGWALSNDPRVKELHFAPGNAGTDRLGENLSIKATDKEAISNWCQEFKPDLVVVGPEAPLCLGVVDELEKIGVPAFGPNQACARLEGSKVFAKELLLEAGIPTARSERFRDLDPALEYLNSCELPIVIKADGLAAGKGVIIAQDLPTAQSAVCSMIEEKTFGEAGAEILIEEFLVGQEASIHAVTDGESYVLFPSSQDHKRIGENDTGPNTGGMGAYAPAPLVTDDLMKSIQTLVFDPLLETMKKRGMNYRGVLYGGLMITANGPKVLEFNSRFGDPETQVLLPLLETPLLDLMIATTEGNLSQLDFSTKDLSALTVVLSSPGYPESPQTGGIIEGLDEPVAEDQIVFQAGTALRGDDIVTSGGRVLAATGLGKTLQEAYDRAYLLAGQIDFDGAHYRRDIGHKALNQG
ncbi:MAG: phosphoribosylamine--glycine ligase [Verrucomicrobiota bacterium]